jgi:hypothetical protein
VRTPDEQRRLDLAFDSTFRMVLSLHSQTQTEPMPIPDYVERHMTVSDRVTAWLTEARSERGDFYCRVADAVGVSLSRLWMERLASPGRTAAR